MPGHDAIGRPAGARRASWAGTAAGLLVFFLLLCGLRPAALFDRGTFTSDFYDAQAHALLEGHLDVDPSVASIEGFVVDGRTHLYFGLVPALLRLPVAAVTDGLDGRLTRLSLLAALAVALWAANRLLWRARALVRADAPPDGWDGVVALGFPVLVATSSPLLWLSSRPVVYHEAELWGAALALVALDRFVRWWDDPTTRNLLVTSLAATVALGTRPSVGSAPVLALAAGCLLRLRPPTLRGAALAAAAVALPIVPYVGLNQARFGTTVSVPFGAQVHSEVDANRQAALEANGGNLFSPAYVPTTLLAYLRPDGIRPQRLPPWVTYAPSPPVVGDAVFDTVDRTASVPAVAPALCVLAAVGVVSLVRRRAGGWLIATAAAAVSVGPTLAIGFVANRYLADFTPALVVPAAAGTWVVAGVAGAAAPWRRRALLVGMGVLAAGGALVGTALTVQAQGLHVLPTEDDRRDFVALQYDLHDRLVGGRPPRVSRAVVADGPGSFGDVRIAGRCEGLYWSDGAYWYPLERGGDRGRRLQGPPAVASAGDVVLDGGDWSMRLVEAGDRVRFVHRGPGGVRAGEPFDPAALRRGVVLVTDPEHGELQVRLDERRVLDVFQPGADDAVVAAPWTATPLETPLCERLDDRLGQT